MSAAATSLGELAVHYGLIPESGRAQLSRTLEAATRAGSPTSLAYLLIPRGTLERVLAAGMAAASVVCDACGHPTPSPRFMAREAIPCGRCGTFLVGFAPYATEPPPTVDPDAAEDVGSRTMDFPQVLVPTPPAAQPLSDAETTAEFDLLTTPPDGTANPFESLEEAGQTARRPPPPAQRPTIEPPRGLGQQPGFPGRPAKLTPESELETIPPGGLADLPGLPGMETIDADRLKTPPPADEPPSGGHATRRRKPARTTGVVPVPTPPALWPWLTAIVLLSILIAIELVVHALI